ncbi:YbjN domain-containing protein [Corynebacterium suedekumii]|nr:YbjN domain-containing protein [Corynebacterium suedekumii]
MVTLTQVYVAAESFDFHAYVGADRLVFPWRDHQVIAYLDERQPGALVFDTNLRLDAGMEDITELARVINNWNRERLGPTVSMRVGDESQVSIHARSATLTGPGLTEQQLADVVRMSMETSRLAVDHIIAELPWLTTADLADDDSFRKDQDTNALSGPLPRDRHIGVNELDDDAVRLRELDQRRSQDDEDVLADLGGDAEPDEEYASHMSTHDDSTGGDWDEAARTGTPEPVTIDRVRATLEGLGIEKTQGGDDVIIAWINDILFGFFLDNGPSYLVKGHWDPNLDPDADFLRMFLLCNDWNEASVTTKAFCHSDDDGLQIRVEFTAPVREGLNDAQLEHNTAVAINQVLHAIDSISSDATGQSAVGWP